MGPQRQKRAPTILKLTTGQWLIIRAWTAGVFSLLRTTLEERWSVPCLCHFYKSVNGLMFVSLPAYFKRDQNYPTSAILSYFARFTLSRIPIKFLLTMGYYWPVECSSSERCIFFSETELGKSQLLKPYILTWFYCLSTIHTRVNVYIMHIFGKIEL